LTTIESHEFEDVPSGLLKTGQGAPGAANRWEKGVEGVYE